MGESAQSLHIQWTERKDEGFVGRIPVRVCFWFGVGIFMHLFRVSAEEFEECTTLEVDYGDRYPSGALISGV